MTVKYTSKRPDEELDGLQDLEPHFTKGNPDDVVVVAVISRHGIAKVDPSNDWQATVRVKHIEQVEGEDEKVVRTLLSEAYSKRTGNTPLPIEEISTDGQLAFDEGAEQ
ncbi:hypothetical protein ACFWHR_04060 [Leucobacter sp. NPDC058333]|uniref:hypothetical protein n=1 Tax=Leucobacter sp. NPDC058333 TaxID=3346450 RepID=UPI00364DC13B